LLFSIIANRYVLIFLTKYTETEPKREEIHEHENEIYPKDTFFDSKRKLEEDTRVEELRRYEYI
jgi:hypothetical protein